MNPHATTISARLSRDTRAVYPAREIGEIGRTHHRGIHASFQAELFFRAAEVLQTSEGILVIFGLCEREVHVVGSGGEI
jgi:hypothetical protein